MRWGGPLQTHVHTYSTPIYTDISKEMYFIKLDYTRFGSFKYELLPCSLPSYPSCLLLHFFCSLSLFLSFLFILCHQHSFTFLCIFFLIQTWCHSSKSQWLQSKTLHLAPCHSGQYQENRGSVLHHHREVVSFAVIICFFIEKYNLD